MRRLASISKALLWTAGLAVCGLAANRAGDAILYTQNFETGTVGSSAAGPGGFFQISNVGGTGYQVQGGGSGAVGPTETAGIDNNGVGGSKALFGTFDSTPSAGGFIFWQIQNFNFSGTTPLGPASSAQISYDMSQNGSTSPTTWSIELDQSNGFKGSTTPILAIDGSYTHVSFLMSTLVPTSSSTNTYDPTLGISTLQFSAGATGYGFDSDNAFHLDNFTVSTVPEPASLGLLAVGGLVGLRRRRA